MQALLIAFLMFITGVAALVILYFLGSFQQMQRNRINRTPRVTHIPKIEPIIENIQPENANMESVETTELSPQTEVPLIQEKRLPAEKSPQHDAEAHDAEHHHVSEMESARKKKIRDWILGGELLD